MKSYKIIILCSYSIFRYIPNKAVCINSEIFSIKSKKYYTDRNVSFLFNTPMAIEKRVHSI